MEAGAEMVTEDRDFVRRNIKFFSRKKKIGKLIFNSGDWSLVLGAKLKTFIVIEIGQNVLNCYAELRSHHERNHE